MPQAIAVAVYNFANAFLINSGVGAIAASNVAHVAAAVASAAAKVAIMTAANAVIANQNKPEAQGNLVNLAINANEPRRLIIGTRQTGGVLVDWNIRGSKNQNLHLIIYLSEGPCGALKKVLAGGRVVYDADVSGAFSHGVRKTLPNFRSGGDRLWVTYHDGRDGQTADSNLISNFPGVWTSDHRGTGCAYVHVEMQWDSDNLTSPPQMSFEIEGAKLYDRRKDSTAGGSGSHRLDDPDTWELSTNPMVAIDHYKLGRYFNGVRVFGIGLPAEDVPYAEFSAHANLCDESVATKAGGTQARYEANGFMFADRSYKDTIKDFCRAMNARPVDRGGRIGYLDGMPKTPVMILTDQDLIEGTTDQYKPKQSWAELVTAVNGTFIDPRQNFQPVSYPDITNPVWDAEDNGQPKFETVDFEMETSQERAERLATLYVQMKRRQARLTGSYRMKAIQLEQGDWFLRTGGKFGDSGKLFEVVDRSFNPQTLMVTLAAFEVDPDDSAWDEDNAADPVPITTPDDSTIPAVEVPAILVTPFSLSAGGLEFPAFRFTNADWADDIPNGVYIEFGLSDGEVSPGPASDVSLVVMAPGQQLSSVYGLIPDMDYVVRVKGFNGGQVSPWSSWVEVSSTPTYSAGEPGEVQWSNVVGVGRPVDFADVTALNIAAGFTGQGWAATQSEFATGNSYGFSRSNVGLARNAQFVEPFTGPAVPPNWTSWANGNGSFGLITGSSAYGALLAGAASTNNGWSQNVPVQANQRYVLEAEVLLATGALTGAGCYIAWRAVDNSIISTETLSFATAADTSGVVGSSRAALTRWEKPVTAPATAVAATIYAMSHWTGHGSTAGANSLYWKLCDLKPLTLVAQIGADVTAGNTAAAISGQGLFATLSSITGTLADTNNLLRRTAGGLYTGALNADLTSANIAAGFTGQGALATLSSVGTTNIAANAVSSFAGSSNDASLSIPATNTWTDVISSSMTTAAGDTVLINANVQLMPTAPWGDGFALLYASARLLVNGVSIRETPEFNAAVNAVFLDFEAPGAGTFDYKVQVKYRIVGSGSTPSPSVVNRSIIMSRFRR